MAQPPLGAVQGEEQEEIQLEEQQQPRQYTRSGRRVRPPARFGEMSEEEERDTSQDISMILSDPERMEEPRVISRDTSTLSLAWDSYEEPADFLQTHPLSINVRRMDEDCVEIEQGTPWRYSIEMLLPTERSSPRWRRDERRRRRRSM